MIINSWCFIRSVSHVYFSSNSAGEVSVIFIKKKEYPLCMNLHVFMFMNLVMYAYLWTWTCELRPILYGFVELMWGVQGVYIFFCFLSMLTMWSDLWSLCIKFIDYYCHSSIIKMLCFTHKYICDICAFLSWHYVHLFFSYLALHVAGTYKGIYVILGGTCHRYCIKWTEVPCMEGIFKLMLDKKV